MEITLNFLLTVVFFAPMALLVLLNELLLDPGRPASRPGEHDEIGQQIA